MDLQLSSKRALVTGGSAGIGYATALLLAQEGCDVVIVARDGNKLSSAQAAIREAADASVETIAADLSSPAEVDRVAAGIERLDILVNNASAVPPGSLLEVDDARWRQGWDLKVFGYIGLCRALYPQLKRSRGVIVNVVGGVRNDPNFIVGATGGAALSAFTIALGKAAASDGMRIVSIHPGQVATERGEKFLRARAKVEWGDESRWQEYYRHLPFGRPASVDEIASAIAFLASPRSGYTNGTTLTMDGGLR